jgi:cytochrome P450
LFFKYFSPSYATAITIRIFKFWLHPEPIYNLSHVYDIEKKAGETCSFVFAPKVIEGIREKMAMDLNNNKDPEEKPKTFIRAFMDPKNNFTESEVLDEINTLIVAAQDTSALATSSTLLLLAMHKDVQDRVVQELQQVLGKSIENQNLKIEQLNELQYLERTINEVMRVMPVVPLVGRRNKKEITLSGGIVIPEKANLVIPIFNIHKNKALWGDDADEFKPERFERENLEKVHPYAFIPFAKGPRMCIGWRYAMFLMKIQLANILLKYELDTSLKLDELEYKFSVTLNICQGHKLSIKKR